MIDGASRGGGVARVRRARDARASGESDATGAREARGRREARRGEASNLEFALHATARN